MRRISSGSFYLSFLQYWSDFPPIHAAYFGQIWTSLCSLLPLHWKIYVVQFRILDVFHVFDGWLPYLEKPQKKALLHVLTNLTVQVRVGARMTWTVLALGVFLVMEQTPIFGLGDAEPDYLVWLRPLIASSKGSVSLLVHYYETDLSDDGNGDVSNWGHLRCIFLRGDVFLVGTSAEKERGLGAETDRQGRYSLPTSKLLNS